MFNFFKKDKKEENIEQQEQPVEQKQEEPKEQSGFISFENLKQAVSKTSESLVGGIMSVVSEHEEIDEDLLDEMEDKLIKADIGLDNAVEIVEKLRDNKSTTRPDQVKDFLKDEFVNILSNSQTSQLNIKYSQLNIILVTGVNGAGKTTLIGKLASRFNKQGKNVIVAAGDTFRAAAEEQLDIWSKRAGAQIVRQDGADPGAVVHDAIKKAKDENAEILLIDTAGRLQNKYNLMEELRKIRKVIDKEAAENLVESILVIDATTGQNGLQQAKVFKEAVDLTAIGLTKLDGSAKGGIIIAIAKELNIPVKLIGVGEKIDDLKDFNPQNFVEALF